MCCHVFVNYRNFIFERGDIILNLLVNSVSYGKVVSVCLIVLQAKSGEAGRDGFVVFVVLIPADEVSPKPDPSLLISTVC